MDTQLWHTCCMFWLQTTKPYAVGWYPGASSAQFVIKSTVTVFPLSLVLQECGLVAQAHRIDERSEWRTFGDKDKESEDPNRVGGPGDPLLDGNLSTIIGKGTKGDGGMAYQLNMMHNRASAQDRALKNAFKAIGGLCERLNLVENIRDHAKKVSGGAMAEDLSCC